MDKQKLLQPTPTRGEWTCSQCGMAISQLPFEPDANKPIFCHDCHRQRVHKGPAR